MNILVELINNDVMCSGNHDTRCRTLVPMCCELNRRGHNIHAIYKKGDFRDLPFTKYNKKDARIIDFYIGHNVYKGSADRYNYFSAKKKIVSTYEAGWLHNSLIIDRKLFADSIYFNDIGRLIKEGFDLEQSKTYCEGIESRGLSKWKQSAEEQIPDIDYIFIPGQVLYDLSIINYCKIGLIEFIERTTKFAKKNKIDVIYKPHPGASYREKKHGRSELELFANEMKKENKHFHVINTSIYDLMRKSRFTACLNAGTIIDNIVTQTPVVSFGMSFFTHSGAILCEEDIEYGLDKMMKKDYDADEMKMQQLRMIWWLKNNMMQEHLPAEENIKRLENYMKVNLG